MFLYKSGDCQQFFNSTSKSAYTEEAMHGHSKTITLKRKQETATLNVMETGLVTFYPIR